MGLIKKYADKLSYWVSEKDKGQSDAINKGFARATGDILYWINSDDVLLPGALEKVASFFAGHPDVGCVIGDLELIDESGKRLSLKKAIPFHFNTALYTGANVPQPAAFFTRTAWEQTGPLRVDLQYQMDFDFFLRMGAKGVRFALLREPLAQFRLHRESKTVSQYRELVQQANRIIQDEYLPKAVRDSKLKAEYLSLLRWVYRARGFFVRALTRGDIVPFKATLARLKV